MSIDDVREGLRYDASTSGLRERVEVLARLRDEAMAWSQDEYDHLAKMLMPYTDAVLHELARREQGEDYEPYPHPAGTLMPWGWDTDAEATEGGA